MSPDDVAQNTAQALCNHDVDALLALTLPEEVDKLHLTRDGVRGFLNETLYTHALPRQFAVKRINDYPVDQLLYHLEPLGNPGAGLFYPFDLIVNQSPDYRWRLPLGYLLLSVSALCTEDKSPGAASHVFKVLAAKYGIRGIRLNASGYKFVGAN
jgi:hypothetical protein